MRVRLVISRGLRGGMEKPKLALSAPFEPVEVDPSSLYLKIVEGELQASDSGPDPSSQEWPGNTPPAPVASLRPLVGRAKYNTETRVKFRRRRWEQRYERESDYEEDKDERGREYLYIGPVRKGPRPGSVPSTPKEHDSEDGDDSEEEPEDEETEERNRKAAANKRWKRIDEKASFGITRELFDAMVEVDKTRAHQNDFCQLLALLYAWRLATNLHTSQTKRSDYWSAILNLSVDALATRLSQGFERYLEPFSQTKMHHCRFVPTAFKVLESDLRHFVREAVKINIAHQDAGAELD
ncbi:hypothetical protein JCM5353_006257 [Sporobolomyces roseus]